MIRRIIRTRDAKYIKYQLHQITTVSVVPTLISMSRAPQMDVSSLLIALESGVFGECANMTAPTTKIGDADFTISTEKQKAMATVAHLATSTSHVLIRDVPSP